MPTWPRLRFGFSLSGLVLLLALSALADNALLPELLNAWQRSGHRQATAANLESLAGPEAAVLLEYGVRQAEQATFQQAGTRWAVTVFEMQDRSGAYGAFTLLRAGSQPLGLGEAGAQNADRTVFFEGNYFVSATPAAGLAELRLLANQLRGRPGRRASLPILPDFLPERGMLPGTDAYLLGPQGLARLAPLAPGDWVGFAYGAEVEAARYRMGSDQATLLLVSYPTPQIAVARMDDMQRYFNLNGTGNPGRPPAYAKRFGTMVAFVAGLDSGRQAAQLFDAIGYDTKVSWSDPSDPRPPADWARTLLNIFIGTGLMLLFALVSGVAYGLFRLAVIRLLPGRIFDRPGDSEVIMLNLNRKPPGDPM